MKLRELKEAVIIKPVRGKVPPVKQDGLEWNTRAPAVNRARNMLHSALNADSDAKRVIAVQDGEVVGAASYYPKAARWIIDRIGSLQKGVGTQLMQYIISAANEKGVSEIELWATDSSNTFYDNFGFKTIGDKGHKLLKLA